MNGSASEVLVLGKGVVGLTTAIVLAEEGLRVSLWHAPQLRPSSHAACALFLPYFGTLLDESVTMWAAKSWKEFAKIAHLPGDVGVSRIDMIEMLRRADPPPTSISQLTEVSLQASTALPEPFRYAWHFNTWLIDIRKYIPYLEERCRAAGVNIYSRTLRNSKAPDGLAPVVINCSGHWTAQLFQKPDVIPIRGQAVILDAPPINTAIGGDQFLLAPRSDGLLIGSLWQEGDADSRIRASDTLTLLDVHARWLESDFFQSLGVRKGSKIVKTVAGVRPYRVTGPLVEIDDSKLGDSLLIHNTGHGGAGITLSWGSALHVLHLVWSVV